MINHNILINYTIGTYNHKFLIKIIVIDFLKDKYG